MIGKLSTTELATFLASVSVMFEWCITRPKGIHGASMYYVDSDSV